jgi:formylglycine-generating enzyme
MLRLATLVLAALSAILPPGAAPADVLNMGGTRDPVTGAWTGVASLDTVSVGDPGNAGNAGYYGAVAYNYQIGKYEVTVAQYCEFLNAKATTTDSYGLWNSTMSSDPVGGIDRSGSAGSYSYAVKTGHANNPAVYVTWYDAMRFANWLNNGQGANGDTETGVYAITGSGPDWTVSIPSAAQRATWAASFGKHWLLESYQEGYKAAYYKGGGVNAGYWSYATRSNTQPTSQAPPGGANSANFCDDTTGFALTGTRSFDSNFDYLTDVGSYANSPGPYGTFDQNGNAQEWTDWDAGKPYAYGLGGHWCYAGNYAMSTAYTSMSLRDSPINYMGFRMTTVGLGYLPGDANQDGAVDIYDLNILLTNFDKTGFTWSQGDFNGDGAVDILDLNKVLTNFDKTVRASTGGINAVPEPAGLALAAMGLIGWLTCQRRGSKRGQKI